MNTTKHTLDPSFQAQRRQAGTGLLEEQDRPGHQIDKMMLYSIFPKSKKFTLLRNTLKYIHFPLRKSVGGGSRERAQHKDRSMPAWLETQINKYTRRKGAICLPYGVLLHIEIPHVGTDTDKAGSSIHYLQPGYEWQ